MISSLRSETFHIFLDKVKTRNFSMITLSRNTFVQAVFFTLMCSKFYRRTTFTNLDRIVLKTKPRYCGLRGILASNTFP